MSQWSSICRGLAFTISNLNYLVELDLMNGAMVLVHLGHSVYSVICFRFLCFGTLGKDESKHAKFSIVCRGS